MWGGEGVVASNDLKEMVHPKMKSHSFATHPYADGLGDIFWQEFHSMDAYGSHELQLE